MVLILAARVASAARLHHHRRADRDDLFDIRVPRQRDLDAVGDKTFHPGRAVVGAQDQLVADGAELVFPEHQILVAETEDPDHVGTGLFVAARLRKHRRDAEAAAHAHHFLRLADVGGDAHRADHAVERGADLAFRLHLPGRLAHRLDHQRDGPFLAVEVRDGQRDALAVLVQHHDHELPRLRGLGHQRMAHLEQIGDIGEILACHDFEIGHCIRIHIGPPLPACLSGNGVVGGIGWFAVFCAADGLCKTCSRLNRVRSRAFS